ncbi:MAG: hypothetical protein Kow00127_13480 [Bacteroidales bacterium]
MLPAQSLVVAPGAENKLDVVQNSYQLLEVNNTMAAMEAMEVKTRVGYFTMITANGYGWSTAKGEPNLPVMKRLIEVPLGAEVSVEILNQTEVEVDLTAKGITDYIMPVQPPLSKSIDDPESVPFEMNQETYSTNEFASHELVRVVDLGIIRGVRIARLEIAPVYYNPVQNKLRVIDKIQVRLSFNGGDIPATLEQKERFYSPLYANVLGQLINYKPLEGKEMIDDEPVTYIIVSDPDFETALQPFVEWKTKKGFKVVEAYTDDPQVGTTTSSIKAYLENFYENPPEGYNPQSFVLIVGDIGEVPPFNGTAGGHVTDLYYCTYDGAGDIYPDCYYGRFSATNLTQLQPQIDKTLQYEQYTFPDPTFLDEVVMVAGADASHALTWGNGQINYGTENYFNLAHGITSHTYLQPEPGGANYSQSIRNDISNGVTFGNYTAHCSANGWADPSFTISNIASLTNADKYPLLIGNCCSSVEFQTTCFGEEILRAANKGALGYIGGSNSTYWDEDFWFGVGFESISANPVYNPDHLGAYDRIFHDHGEPLDEWYITQGQVPTAGNLAVTQAGSSLETYYWEIYHLMGDPSVMIYFTQPPETTANYQGLMPLAAETFDVVTEPFGYVAISKDGELHGCGLADETGFAQVNMFDPITVPGEADVVITGQNIRPYIGTVTVASPEGAYVLFDEYVIDDSNGNGNGQVDYGEYILLDVSLENLGSATATNVTATISTSDEYVTLDQNTFAWPDIPAGATSLESGAFAFTVDQVIPDQHNVVFDMVITDGTDTWNSTFSVMLNAPVLEIGSYTINDGAGNNNGRLDPGETAIIIVPNDNTGHSDALEAVAAAVSMSPYITLTNSTVTLGTLAAGSSADAAFQVEVAANAPVGEVVSVQYNIEAAPYSAATTLDMSIGLIVEDFETGNFNMFEWEMLGDAEWEITDQDPYEGVYSAKSGDINDNQVTSIQLTADVSTDDVISFWYKVSSESNYDYLKFFIDDNMMDEWSGEVSWTQASYDVSAGTHTFRWEYVKDYSVSSGGDCAWIDYILFPPLGGMSPLGVMVTASPGTICQGESTQLNAYAAGGTGNYSYEWMPEGSLNDPTVANPIATPDVTTTYYVVVDDGENTVTGEVTVTVNETPEQPVITQNGPDLISSAVSGNQWYNSEGAIPGATGQVYTPQATDNYYVIVTSAQGCSSEPSDPFYFVYTGIVEQNSNRKVEVYPNPFGNFFTVDYFHPANSSVTLRIYNAFGQLITVIERDKSSTGANQRIRFDTSDFEPGVYLLTVESGDYTVTRRIVHTR